MILEAQISLYVMKSLGANTTELIFLITVSLITVSSHYTEISETGLICLFFPPSCFTRQLCTQGVNKMFCTEV